MSEDGVAIADMPKTALQALYNAVTGKTENISKSLYGNVIISASDISTLHAMIHDQVALYHCVAAPTTTVVVRDEKHRTQTFSSWARFSALSAGKNCVTSEVGLRVEILVDLPQTGQPQRCIVDFNLDSALPVMIGQRSESLSDRALGMFLVFNEKWKTVEVSIDFVDYMVAKSFLNIVEEWFDNLKRSPERKFNRAVFDKFDFLRRVLDQSGRFGCAAFLLFSAWAYLDSGISLPGVLGVLAISLMVWAAVQVSMVSLSKQLFRKLARNLIPSVIVLDEFDRVEFERLKSELNSPLVSLAKAFGGQLVAIAVNILASYLWWKYGLR